MDMAQSCIAKGFPLSPSCDPPEALASTWKKLVARVYVPLLDSLSITLFNQLTFDIPQLLQFQSRRKAKVTQLGRAGIERLGPRDNPRAGSLLRILLANQPTSDWAGFIDGTSMRILRTYTACGRDLHPRDSSEYQNGKMRIQWTMRVVFTYTKAGASRRLALQKFTKEIALVCYPTLSSMGPDHAGLCKESVRKKSSTVAKTLAAWHYRNPDRQRPISSHGRLVDTPR